MANKPQYDTDWLGVIQKIQRENGGEYSCSASNIIGKNHSQSLHLDIKCKSWEHSEPWPVLTKRFYLFLLTQKKSHFWTLYKKISKISKVLKKKLDSLALFPNFWTQGQWFEAPNELDFFWNNWNLLLPSDPPTCRTKTHLLYTVRFNTSVKLHCNMNANPEDDLQFRLVNPT